MKTEKPRSLTISLMQEVNDLSGRLGISVTELAKELGMPRSQISEYLNGNRSSPNSETTLRLLRWCEIAKVRKVK